jgi:hypothetical protein
MNKLIFILLLAAWVADAQIMIPRRAGHALSAPANTQVLAAQSTINSNPLCSPYSTNGGANIGPYYWEIGNVNGVVGAASGSVPYATPIAGISGNGVVVTLTITGYSSLPFSIPGNATAVITNAGTYNGTYTVNSSVTNGVTIVSNKTGSYAGGGTVTFSVNANTVMVLASASKWIYATYYLQAVGGVANLSTADIAALHQTDGYTNEGADTCPVTAATGFSPNIAYCLSQSCLSTPPNCGADGTNNVWGYQEPGNTGSFWYSGTHFTAHAGSSGPPGGSGLGNSTASMLSSTVFGALKAAYSGAPTTGSTTIQYGNVNTAGGLNGNAASYTAILRGILSGSLYMKGALFNGPGNNLEVPTLPTQASQAKLANSIGPNYSNNNNYNNSGYGNSSAQSTPLPENQTYSMGHWVENQTGCLGTKSTTARTLVACSGGIGVNDGSASSPGSFGFYPWIDASVTYYGVIALSAGGGNGFPSEQCGRVVRRAFITGIAQPTAYY